MKIPKRTQKPKAKAPLLSPEALEKLTRDSYCFNLEHEGEIEHLKFRIELLQKEKEAVEKGVAERIAQRESELAVQSIRAREEIDEAKKRIGSLEEELGAAVRGISDLEAKLASAEENMKKKFKDEARCFDIMHKAVIQGRSMHSVSVPELFIFSILSVTRPPGPASIMISIDPGMASDLETAKKTVNTQLARKLGEELKSNPNLIRLGGEDFGVGV